MKVREFPAVSRCCTILVPWRHLSEFTHLLSREYIDKLQKVAKNAPGVISLENFVREVITAGGNFLQFVEGDDPNQEENAL